MSFCPASHICNQAVSEEVAAYLSATSLRLVHHLFQSNPIRPVLGPEKHLEGPQNNVEAPIFWSIHLYGDAEESRSFHKVPNVT
jgi:hypothetical protein